MNLEFNIRFNMHHFLNPSVPHVHKDLEFLICLEDGGRFLMKTDYYPLVKGSVFVVPAGTSHHCIVDVSSYKRYIIHISYESLWALSSPDTNLISVFEKSNPYLVFNEEELEQIKRLIDHYLSVEKDFGSYMKKNICAMEIILFLMKVCHCDQPNTKAIQSKSFIKIVPIIDYIHQNYTSEINLEQLSQSFYISKYYLCRLFKDATGFNISEYVKNYRIRQSCLLLLQGASVQEAGESVGYYNCAHFIRTFKNVIGITPGKYASTHSEEPPLE